jgi:RNA polymerase sigma factor (sigma-70 family)
MLVAHKTDWDNAANLPTMPVHLSPAEVSRDDDRGYADETIIAQLPTLKKYARRLTRSAHLAEDLVQDCLARALSRRHLFHSDANITPWLFTLMRNLHVSNSRQLGVRMTFARNQTAILSEEGDASQEHTTDLKRVLRAIDMLPKGQRDVIVLVAIQELSHKEAAKVLNIPIGTVMSRLARGRDRIRTILNVTART